MLIHDLDCKVCAIVYTRYAYMWEYGLSHMPRVVLEFVEFTARAHCLHT